MDVIVHVGRLPTSGETILGERGSLAAGGKGLNQAAAACRAGAATKMVGMVGDDAFGRRLIEYARDIGIDCDHVDVTDASLTGIATITVAADGANMIAYAPGANGLIDEAALARAKASIMAADTMLVQLETPYDIVRRALEFAREGSTLSILNPAPADSAAIALCGLADVVTPNEHELHLLTGLSFGEDDGSLQAAMEALMAHGPKGVVVTLGARGCAALWEGRFIRVPGYAVRVADTTGAGDTFSGALATALGEGMEIREALRFASAAAAISVTRVSAEGAAPTRDEIVAFLAETETAATADTVRSGF